MELSFFYLEELKALLRHLSFADCYTKNLNFHMFRAEFEFSSYKEVKLMPLDSNSWFALC